MRRVGYATNGVISQMLVRSRIASLLRPINRIPAPNAYLMSAAIKTGVQCSFQLWRLR